MYRRAEDHGLYCFHPEYQMKPLLHSLALNKEVNICHKISSGGNIALPYLPAAGTSPPVVRARFLLVHFKISMN